MNDYTTEHEQLLQNWKDQYVNLNAPSSLSEEAGLAELEDMVAYDRAVDTYRAKVLDHNTTIANYTEGLQTYEGSYNNASFFHKPSSGSGWTIGAGLDLMYQTPKSLRLMGVPERLIQQAINSEAFGKTTVPVPNMFRRERMTEDEFDKVTLNIAKKSGDTAEALREKLPNLSSHAISKLLNFKHWAGGFSSQGESKQSRWLNNINDGVKVTANTAGISNVNSRNGGSLVSPVLDVINNPDSTDEDLAVAFDSLSTSYHNDNPTTAKAGKQLRIKTLEKYAASVRDGEV